MHPWEVRALEKNVSEWAVSFLRCFFGLANRETRHYLDVVLESLSTQIPSWSVKIIVLIMTPIGEPTKQRCHSFIKVPMESGIFFICLLIARNFLSFRKRGLGRASDSGANQHDDAKSCAGTTP